MKQRLRRVGIALGILVGFFILFVLVEHIRGRVALNAYKADLRAKGEKLTMEELAPVHTAESASRTKAFYTAAIQVTNEFTRLSELQHEVVPMRMTVPGQASVAWASTELRSSATNQVGRIAQTKEPAILTWADLARWMDEHEKSLAALRSALNPPAATEGEDWHLLSHRKEPMSFLLKAQAAQHLAMAAINDLHQGRLDKALENIQALSAIARLHQDDKFLIGLLVRDGSAGIDRLGTAVVWEALQKPGWNDAQLGAMQKEWQGKRFLKCVPGMIELERAFGKDAFDLCRNQGFGAYVTTSQSEPSMWNSLSDWKFYFFPIWKVAWSDQDELFDLRYHQVILETARRAIGQSWTECRPTFATLFQQYQWTFPEGIAGFYRKRFLVSSYRGGCLIRLY